MSFEGFRPLIYFERHDFMLVAMDAIGNHMNQIERISHGEFKCPVILRSVIDDGGIFYSGPTHSQDFTDIFRNLKNFSIYSPTNGNEIINSYEKAILSNRPSIIIERKGLY